MSSYKIAEIDKISNVMKLLTCSKLIIASEYALERDALIKLFDDEVDVEILAQASSISDLEMLIGNQAKADILILDSNLSGLDIVETMKLIKQKTPHLKVLLLTTNTDEVMIIEAIFAGCLGYISKNSTSSDLLKSIKSLRRCEVWIERRLMAKIISRFSSFYIQRITATI